ncbi:MAG: ferredoxin-type protein NapF [Gammaproteobacteria bacterium]|nr:ferredoxin-type protein NapF [Gammaproteobacteria bacterium]
MGSQVSRMQFLRGDFKGKETPLRPPWAVDESLFTEICTNCGECIPQCPTHIIKQARANFPVIDFTSGECLFCEECVDVCKPKALLKNTRKSPWSIKASISKGVCIAHKGVECRSCYDPCEARAIMMPPRLGGISIPIISPDNCTGCGACFSVCPVQAVTMGPLQ